MKIIKEDLTKVLIFLNFNESIFWLNMKSVNKLF